MGSFPFFEIAVGAVFIHIVSGLLAVTIEAIWNGGGWTKHLWRAGPWVTIRLFTVERHGVRFRASWCLILIARTTVVIFAVAFVLSIMTT